MSPHHSAILAIQTFMTYGSITYHVVLVNNLWIGRWNNSHPFIRCFTHAGTFNNNVPNYFVPPWFLHCYMCLQLNAKDWLDYALIFYVLMVFLPHAKPTYPSKPSNGLQIRFVEFTYCNNHSSWPWTPKMCSPLPPTTCVIRLDRTTILPSLLLWELEG